MYFEVHWYEGLALFNFVGMAYGRAERPNAVFHAFLDEMLGGNAWRSKYCTIIAGGFFLDTLRMLLKETCGAYNWIEISAGKTYQQYRALDLYIRLSSAGMKPPKEESWFLLNCSGECKDRMEPHPENWWWYYVLVSNGQRPVMTEWFMEVFGRVMDPTAAMRIQNMMGHLKPDRISLDRHRIPDFLRLALSNEREVRDLAGVVSRMRVVDLSNVAPRYERPSRL